MITLTVHNIDDAIKDQLEINATQRNCSVEEEVCRILKQALFSTIDFQILNFQLY